MEARADASVRPGRRALRIDELYKKLGEYEVASTARKKRKNERPAWEEPPTLVGEAAKGITLTGVLLVMLVPLWIIVVTSLSTQAAVTRAGGLVIWPDELTFEAYRIMLEDSTVRTALLVSLGITAVGTLVSMAVSVMCASRLDGLLGGGVGDDKELVGAQVHHDPGVRAALGALGGRDNILELSLCASRLCVSVRDPARVDEPVLLNDEHGPVAKVQFHQRRRVRVRLLFCGVQRPQRVTESVDAACSQRFKGTVTLVP